MTAPRRIVPGTTWLITRRCSERRFFLRPSQLLNQIVLYVLGVAARRHGILVHAFCFLSNHCHIVLTDPRGELPGFMQYLDSLVARAVNASLGRFEGLWATDGSYPGDRLAGTGDRHRPEWPIGLAGIRMPHSGVELGQDGRVAPPDDHKDTASTDLTLLHLLKYREAARHLWNCFLREEDRVGYVPEDFLLDRWEAIQEELFAALVLRYTGDDTPEKVSLGPGAARPLPFLKVVPTSPEVPAHVSRTKPALTYWDHPVQKLGPTDDLRFIAFFDFGSYDYVDFKFFHVLVQGSETHPELAGHEALVEVRYAKVLLDTSASMAGGSP